MDSAQKFARLEEIALKCREEIIPMIYQAASGHPGGSLSVIDIIVALFCEEMRWDPKNPNWEERDRFILSKGHGVPALYAVLAQHGVVRPEELSTLRRIGSRLQGHPDRVMMPVVEASTGSLGQGLSIAQGIAMGLKLRGSSSRVFCVIGDGESQEGQVWEAAMSAPKFKLNNLICFLDSNNGQIDGKVEQVMDIRPIADKWRAFRWNVQEIDGHSMPEILESLQKAKNEKESPCMIIAHTVKGKGVSFMEGNIDWHGKAPNAEELKKAMAELKGQHS
jgi:transketolase